MPARRLICFGDSITECRGYAEADRWTSRLAFLLERWKAGCWEVHNRGVGGNTTALALDRFRSDIAPLLPALVLLEFGINDAYVYPWSQVPRVGLADYEKNLEEMIRQVRAAQGEPVIIVNHPITFRKDLHQQGDGGAIGTHLQPYTKTARAIAQLTNTAAIDLPYIIRRRRMRPSSLLSQDGVHLSPRGSRLYADLLFEWIKVWNGALPKAFSS